MTENLTTFYIAGYTVADHFTPDLPYLDIIDTVRKIAAADPNFFSQDVAQYLERLPDRHLNMEESANRDLARGLQVGWTVRRLCQAASESALEIMARNTGKPDDLFNIFLSHEDAESTYRDLPFHAQTAINQHFLSMVNGATRVPARFAPLGLAELKRKYDDAETAQLEARRAMRVQAFEKHGKRLLKWIASLGYDVSLDPMDTGAVTAGRLDYDYQKDELYILLDGWRFSGYAGRMTSEFKGRIAAYFADLCDSDGGEGLDGWLCSGMNATYGPYGQLRTLPDVDTPAQVGAAMLSIVHAAAVARAKYAENKAHETYRDALRKTYPVADAGQKLLNALRDFFGDYDPIED